MWLSLTATYLVVECRQFLVVELQRQVFRLQMRKLVLG
jgi:hypothetical protein